MTFTPQTTTNQYSASNQYEGSDCSVFTFNNPNTKPNQRGSNYKREFEREKEKEKKSVQKYRQTGFTSPQGSTAICLRWKSTIELTMQMSISLRYTENISSSLSEQCSFCKNLKNIDLKELAKKKVY